MNPEPVVRRATLADLPACVGLFQLPGDGVTRDVEAMDDPAAYVEAFHALADDDDNTLYVAEVEREVVGVFQLTFIRHVAHRGGLVARVEAVVVAPERRGGGIGASMMRFAIAHARARGAFRLELTSNVRRTRAHRFYERLGFVSSHVGMKLALP